MGDNSKELQELVEKNCWRNKLTWEEMATFAAEIEAALNSRPLTPLESTAEDGTEALTPGHFLIGRPSLSLPTDDKKLENITTLRRWNLLQHLITEFWRRWNTEHLVNLNHLTKWKCSQRPIQQGDVVSLKDNMFPNKSWPLARVQDVHPGPDGLPRVVMLKTSKGMYKRAANRLVLLVPIEDQELPVEDHCLCPEDG